MRCLEGEAGGEAKPSIFVSVGAGGGGLPPPVVVTSVENRLPPTSSSRMCTEQMPGESAGGKALCSGPVWIWFCFKWKLMEEAPGLGHLDNGPALLHCGMKTGV